MELSSKGKGNLTELQCLTAFYELGYKACIPYGEDALDTLHNNITDLWEYCYDYAVLEPYYEGICGYGSMEERQFFKFDRERDGYFEIEEPDCVKHLCGFSIG